jgi:hypothetical protein
LALVDHIRNIEWGTVPGGVNLAVVALAAGAFLNPIFIWLGAVLERFFFMIMFVARGRVPRRFPLTPLAQSHSRWGPFDRYIEAVVVFFIGVSCVYVLHKMGVER